MDFVIVAHTPSDLTDETDWMIVGGRDRALHFASTPRFKKYTHVRIYELCKKVEDAL